MKANTKVVALGLAFILLLTSAPVTTAMPPLPSSFFGTVKVDGANAPADTAVSAWINGVKYAETPLSTHAGDTTYGLDLPGDDASTPGLVEGGVAGNTIVFFIGDQAAAQTGTWQSGVNVRLNLTFTTAQDTTPPVTTASVTGTLKCAPDVFANATVALTPNEPASTRYRLQPFGGAFGAWQNYIGPLAVTGEGANQLEFASTDVAGNAEAVKALTVKLSSFPAANVRDTFNRANGTLGSNWYGDAGGASYRIASNRVDVRGSWPIYWRPASFGAKQEAYITLNTVDPNGREQDLLLKVQGSTPSWTLGAIEVLYDARAKAVRVETFRPGQSAWTIYPNTAVTFQNGDRLGARALANGEVWIYRNCELIAKITLKSADQTFFNSKGGRIGVWFIDATLAFFDDFGGGNAP